MGVMGAYVGTCVLVVGAVLIGLAVLALRGPAPASPPIVTHKGSVEPDRGLYRWWCDCASYGWAESEDEAWSRFEGHRRARLETVR